MAMVLFAPDKPVISLCSRYRPLFGRQGYYLYRLVLPVYINNPLPSRPSRRTSSIPAQTCPPPSNKASLPMTNLISFIKRRPPMSGRKYRHAVIDPRRSRGGLSPPAPDCRWAGRNWMDQDVHLVALDTVDQGSQSCHTKVAMAATEEASQRLVKRPSRRPSPRAPPGVQSHQEHIRRRPRAAECPDLLQGNDVGLILKSSRVSRSSSLRTARSNGPAPPALAKEQVGAVLGYPYGFQAQPAAARVVKDVAAGVTPAGA